MNDKIKEVIYTTFFSSLFGSFCVLLKINSIIALAIITTCGGILGLFLSSLKFSTNHKITLSTPNFSRTDLVWFSGWVIISSTIYFTLSENLTYVASKIFEFGFKEEYHFSKLELEMQKYQLMGAILFYLSSVVMTLKEWYEYKKISEIEMIYTMAPIFSAGVFFILMAIFIFLGHYLKINPNYFTLIIPFLPSLSFSLVMIENNKR